jgi:ABC-type Mn2+/Zn2+ transport system permease subunit
MIAVSVILLIAVLVIAGATAKAQTNQPHTQVILNLLNGQQYFGTPHVY